MIVNKEGKIIARSVKIKKGWRAGVGLMFRRSIKEDSALLLKLNSKYVHSFFVFFPFRAIVLNENLEVVDEFVMKPFRIKRVNGTWILETNVNNRVKKRERLFIMD